MATVALSVITLKGDLCVALKVSAARFLRCFPKPTAEREKNREVSQLQISKLKSVSRR